MKRLLLCLLTLGACTNETQAPTPTLDFVLPIYGGFDDALSEQPVAIGPSGIIGWEAGWSGECEHSNLTDSDSSYSCDSQSFKLFLSCAGDDCTADPASALTNDGASFSGVGGVNFSPATTGTFDTTATITHGSQTLTQTQTVNVLQPDALVLECNYEPSGDSTSAVACPRGATPYVAGAVYLFYVYAKQGDQLVDVTADLALDGFTVEPGTAATPIHDTVYVNATGPGDYAIHASFGALSADYAITIQ